MGKQRSEHPDSGLQVRQPELLTNKPSAAAGFLLDFLLTWLSLAGALWCLADSFALPVLPLPVGLGAGAFSALFLAAFHFRSARAYLLIGAGFFYFMLLFTLREQLVSGLLIAVNQILSVWTEKIGFSFPVYVITFEAARYPALCTASVLAALFPLAGLFSLAVYQKSFLLSFFFTLPFWLPALALSINLNLTAMLALVVCWSVLLFVRPVNRRGRFSRSHAVLRADGSAATKIGYVLFCAVAACFALVLLLFPVRSYKPPVQVETVRTAMLNAFAGVGPLFKVGNNLDGYTGQVNLNNIGSVRFYGKTMLQVWTRDSIPLYLKGFTGSVFTGEGWQQLPGGQYDAVESQLDGMNPQNMMGKYLSLFPGKNTRANQYEVRVKNIAAGRRRIYAPYNLITAPENITGVSFIGDASICSNYLVGTARYNLYAYDLSRMRLGSSPAGVYMSALTDRPFLAVWTSIDGSGALGAYLLQQEQFEALNRNNLKAYYTSRLPTGLLYRLEGDKRSFVTAEQAYRQFLYEPYTDLPDDLREDILVFLKQKGLLKTYGSVEDMVAAVQSLLWGYTYTLDPGSVPKGQDFTEYFLFEHKKGYCVHFATAGAVMLRAMGVPARYAEGYIVTGEDYKDGADGYANVKDNHAHAWVEVYFPGLGWQPVEVTSGFRVTASGVTDINPENSAAPSPSSSPGSTAPAATAGAPASAAPAAVNSKLGPAAAWTALIFLVSALPVFLLTLYIRRKLTLIRRERRFSARDANRAVLDLYAYCMKLKQYGGEIDPAITELAERARFSPHRIREEERTACRTYADSFARKRYKTIDRRGRWRFKYIDNLL